MVSQIVETLLREASKYIIYSTDIISLKSIVLAAEFV